jgi:hypothetical protein
MVITSLCNKHSPCLELNGNSFHAILSSPILSYRHTTVIDSVALTIASAPHKPKCKKKVKSGNIRRLKEHPTLIVLSAPPVIRRVPVISNVEQNTPASASREPGCGTSSMFWNGVPVL